MKPKPVLSRAQVLDPPLAVLEPTPAPLEPTPAPRRVEWRPAWHEVEPSESHWREAPSIEAALAAARRVDCAPEHVELRDAETHRPLPEPAAHEETP